MSTEGEQGSLIAHQAACVASVEATGAPTPLGTTVTTSSGESTVVLATSVFSQETGAVSYFPSVTIKRNEMETEFLLSSSKRTKVETREVPEQAPPSESTEPAITDEATGQATLLLGSGTAAGGTLFLGSVPDTSVAGTNTNHTTSATCGNSHIHVGEHLDHDESQVHQVHPDAHASTKVTTNLLKRPEWWEIAEEFRSQEEVSPITQSATTTAEEKLTPLEGRRHRLEKTREDACDEMRASMLVLRQNENGDQQELQRSDSPHGSPGGNSRFPELQEQVARTTDHTMHMHASQDIESEPECIHSQHHFQIQDPDSYAAELFPLSYRNPAPESIAAIMFPAASNYNIFVLEAHSGEMYPAYYTQGHRSMSRETYPEQVYHSVPAYNAVVTAPSSSNYQAGNELFRLSMHNSRYLSGDSLPVATLMEPEAGGAYEVIQHSNGVRYEVAQSSIYGSQNNSHHVGTPGYSSPTTQRGSWMTPDHPTVYASSLGLNVNFESNSALVFNLAPPPITETCPEALYSLSLRRDADNGGNSTSYFSSQRAPSDPKELGLNPGYRPSTFGVSTSNGTGMSYGASSSDIARNPMGSIMFNVLNRGGASLSLLSNEEPQMYSKSNYLGGSQDQESLLDSPVRETGSHNAFATTQQALAERAQDFATLNSTYVQETSAQTVNEGYNATWRNNELVFLGGGDAQAHQQSFSDQLNAQLEQTDNAIFQYGSFRSSFPFQAHQHPFFQTNDLSPAPGPINNSQSESLTASQLSFPTQVYQHSFFQTNDSPSSGLPSMSQSSSLTMASEQPSLMLFNNGISNRQSLMLYSSQGYINRGLGRLDTQSDFSTTITSTSTPMRDSRNESSEGQYLGNLRRYLPRGHVQLDGVPMPMDQVYPRYHNVHTGNTYTGNDQFQASSSSRFNQCSTFGDIIRDLLNELVTFSVDPRRQRTTATHDRQGTTQAGGSQASSMTGGSSLENNQALVVNDGIGTEVARLEHMLRQRRRTLPGTLNSHLTDSQSGEPTGMFAAPIEETTDNLESRKLTLFVFIQQVDESWRTYSGHLIEIINLFNSVTCPGAATPYTALASQAMSRYFKCLRDALSEEYRAVRRRLGEQDTAPVYERRKLSPNQLFDQQQRRQQKAIQQLSMLQRHAWRPQRGLPGRAVIVLRSWLLERFLHPYPKDGDKIHLAKQTGLTRNQVSNWFINARVRLWKPMVEEMYKDEFNSDQTGS